MSGINCIQNLVRKIRYTPVKSSKAKKDGICEKCLHCGFQCPRGWVQGRGHLGCSPWWCGDSRNLEGRDTEQWLTPAWGEKQLSSATFGPGLFPVTDLISTLLVLLQLLCMQGRQFPWFDRDMEIRSQGNTPHQEERNSWFLWKALRAVTGAVSDFNDGHELPDLPLSSQCVPHLIHYLPPNLFPFCNSHLSQWLTTFQLLWLPAWVLWFPGFPSACGH